jgi:hypothetical protein
VIAAGLVWHILHPLKGSAGETAAGSMASAALQPEPQKKPTH